MKPTDSQHIHSMSITEGPVIPGPNAPPLAHRTSVMPRLLSVEDAARYLNVSKRVVWSILEAGELRRVRLPMGNRDVRRVLFDVRDLDRLVDTWKDAA